MNIFWISLGQGLAVAAILALSSVAFTLEYAVSRVVNLAHGEVLTIGAYAAYVSEVNLHQNIYVCAIIATVFGSLAAVAMNWTVIERFRNQKSLSTLIATLGVSLVLQNLLLIIFGGASLSYAFSQGNLLHVGPFYWTTLTIEVMVSAVLVAFLIYVLLQRTRLGKALRAVSQNRELSQVSGIPARGIVMRTWAVAGAVSGFAGFLYGETVGTISPTIGNGFLLLSITAAVGGGLGRPYATLGGALTLGLVMSIAGTYVSSAYQLVIAFGFLVVMLLIKPNGIFVRGSAQMVRA
ncbi:MAG: branched-chain amino acid ABC transporter permease [Acidobacteriota bacterium]|nr:branched-chain amino acid ABC transporter permease [Acidobacteriota bacterium]MDE3092477.1 branched-chain amino acid ABC transporter permease [Acidobacteriota bacterium]MDE3138487.1 branched-chain amino acid ABC transporter permease [Acidobacteriota bacterium]MDE3146280.1 branched-chain amino acid ABC transporter permease [Acidobacteriota bacterium]